MIRLFDVLLATFALVLLSPILILVMVILKFTGEGEIFYFQTRVGRYAKEFEITKFATMLKDSPNLEGGHITTAGDPRVLPFGKFLRKTKINELPQLINILNGDMSFVGPRPITSDHFKYYGVEAQNIIAQVRPGLTGLGSIFFRDEERLLGDKFDVELTYRNKIAPLKEKLEVLFVEKNSIGIYFLLIILTAVVVVAPRTAIANKILMSIYNLPPELQAIRHPDENGEV